MQSWADAEWFLSKPAVAEKITVTVFKVTGETNTDDLSPAPDAWSRPDIPLHGLAMLKIERDGIIPDVPGSVGPIKQMEELASKGHPLAYVGDVVGTGSSRKSATNSVLWFMGDDIPNVPNKKGGGVCIGAKIAPIFFNTMEDSGALPIEMDVSKLNMGDVIEIYPYEGVVKNAATGEVLTNFELKTPVIMDEVRAGGRIPLIIGRGNTTRARESLGLPPSDVFVKEGCNCEGTSRYDGEDRRGNGEGRRVDGRCETESKERRRGSSEERNRGKRSREDSAREGRGRVGGQPPACCRCGSEGCCSGEEG